MRQYTIVIEQGDDGFLIGSVAELPGCHTQARTRKQLRSRLREAIQLYRSVEKEPVVIGVEQLKV